MKVSEVMTAQVETVSPEDTVQEAAFKMKDLDVGPMPVVDGGRVVGMITDRDIVVRSTAAGEDPRQRKVRDVMSPEVISCQPDDDVQRVSDLMRDKQVRRVLVVDGSRLVGIVSLGDLAVDANRQAKASKVLEDVSEPAAPRR